MSVLYHLTAPPPIIDGTDAVLQEAEILREKFGGELVFLLPSSRPRAGFPRPLYGMHRLPAIRRLECHVDLHHVYNSELYVFPMLRFLRKPIVYSAVAGLGPEERIPSRGSLSRLDAIVVPSRLDGELLNKRRVPHVHRIVPGIDMTQFTPTPVPTGPEFVLMAGSAPWNRDQFRTKGVDALLELVERTPSLRVVFLWRGLLEREIGNRVRSRELDGRVEILNERVDVNRVLERVHAAIALAAYPRLIKAYPHSLLEALACGRPVLVSESIAMAEYVRNTGCGEVVRSVEADGIAAAIRRLQDRYEERRAGALRARGDFSMTRLLAAYEHVYDAVRKAGSGASET